MDVWRLRANKTRPDYVVAFDDPKWKDEHTAIVSNRDELCCGLCRLKNPQTGKWKPSTTCSHVRAVMAYRLDAGINSD